ncbi:MAG: ABC transporter substrate-binding protein [Christensenellales bacterium]
MKKGFSFIIVLVMMLGMVLVSAQAGQTVEMRAAWWGDTKRHELYGSIIDEFMKANPDVKVTGEPVSWNDYWDKLSVQVAGGNAPDFIGMHPQYAADYIGRGMIEPLDPYIADGTIKLEGWQQGTVNTGVINGTTYMLSMGVTFTSVFVNEDLFKEAGMEVPSFDWTYDDLKEAGLKARAYFDSVGKPNTWLIGDMSTNINSFRYFVRQNGRELYDVDGNINFTQEDVEKWFAMFKEFRDLGIIPDASTSTEYFNATLEDSLFSRNMIMLTQVPINQLKLYKTTFPDKNVGAIRIPSLTGGVVGEFPEGAHFAIYAKSSPEAKLAAAKLINFWLNTPTALAIFKLDQGVPGNLGLQDAYLSALDQYQLLILDFVNKLSTIATPTIYPPKGASEIDLLFRTIGEAVQFDTLTPAEAAAQAYTEAVAIRAK